MNPSNNLFGNLSTEGVEQPKDVLGGQFGAVDSGVYDATIKLVYAGQSDKGARFVDVTLGINANGQMRDYNERLYVTNRQGQPYYERDGKKNPLPDYTVANDLALLSTGHDLSAQPFEEKLIKLYDRNAQAEVPTKVMVATGMLGKQVKIGVLKAIEAKTKKNETSGDYDPVFENGVLQTRETNTIDKVFHHDTHLTVSEFVRKNAGQLDKAEFMDQWANKNDGRVVDKTTKITAAAGGKAGTPGQQGTAPAATGPSTSLFGG